MTTAIFIGVPLALIAIVLVSAVGTLSRIADALREISVAQSTSAAVQMAYLANAETEELRHAAAEIDMRLTIARVLADAQARGIKVEDAGGEVEKP